MPGYTYESAIRDLVIGKQVTERNITSIEEDMKTREGQLRLAKGWSTSEQNSVVSRLRSISAGFARGEPERGLI